MDIWLVEDAETRGRGKMCSRLSRYQPMVPSSSMSCGRPSQNHEMQNSHRRVRFFDICEWALYLKMTKIYQYWPFLIVYCEGPTDLLIVEALLTGWLQFCIVCDTGRRRQHLFLRTPKITALPGLGSLMEIDQHSTMRCTRTEW